MRRTLILRAALPALGAGLPGAVVVAEEAEAGAVVDAVEKWRARRVIKTRNRPGVGKRPTRGREPTMTGDSSGQERWREVAYPGEVDRRVNR